MFSVRAYKACLHGQLSSNVRPHKRTMVDLVGFLTSPRVFLGAVIGLLAGLGCAYLLRSIAGPQVPIELLALIVALGIFVGILLGARDKGRE